MSGHKTLTLGEGTTEKVIIMRSGYSSRTLEISSVPMPLPVPPPSEWHTWKPARQADGLHRHAQHSQGGEFDVGSAGREPF